MPDLKKVSLDFEQLPAFARFIFENHLEEYVRTLLRLSREYDIPTLKYFNHLSEEELFKLSLKNNTEFLQSLVNNKAAGELESSLKNWRKFQTDFVKKDQIQLDDLLL